jgi:TPR repeat protein
MKKEIVCLVTLLILCCGLARGDALDDAYAAYAVGNYAKAIKLFRPLPEKGNATAQYGLGSMCYEGQGG